MRSTREVTILECKRRYEHPVIHVFYKVKPTDVQHQSSESYKNAFVEHERKYENKTKMQIWRDALNKSAEISGIASLNFGKLFFSHKYSLYFVAVICYTHIVTTWFLKLQFFQNFFQQNIFLLSITFAYYNFSQHHCARIFMGSTILCWSIDFSG